MMMETKSKNAQKAGNNSPQVNGNDNTIGNDNITVKIDNVEIKNFFLGDNKVDEETSAKIKETLGTVLSPSNIKAALRSQQGSSAAKQAGQGQVAPEPEQEQTNNIDAGAQELSAQFKKELEEKKVSLRLDETKTIESFKIRIEKQYESEQTEGTSIRPTSLKKSAGELKGKEQEKYIHYVQRASRNYKKKHVVFLSAITRNEEGAESTEYHVARQLTKILRARGIPVFWWEDPEGKESDNRKYSEWRTIGTKIAMGLAFSSVFIGLSFDSVKFNGEGDRHDFQYTWLSQEETYRDRYKNFCYEVNTFAGFIRKDNEEKPQESFIIDITDPSALPSERTMLMFSYGSQDEVRESESFDNRDIFKFEEVEYRNGEPLEDRVDHIVEEILSALYADLLTPSEQAGENHNNVYRQDIFDMSERAYKHDKTQETFEHWFKTVRADEKLAADREGRGGGNYETYFHHAPNTPSDRYFKYAIVDEKGEDVAVGARPPFEIFLERRYSADKSSYNVCLVVNDWNDVCLYRSEGGDFFNYVYSQGGEPIPTLSPQSEEKYPLAKYTSFSVRGSRSSAWEKGRKPIAKEGGPYVNFEEKNFNLRRYKGAGGKYYLCEDLDEKTVMTQTCTLTFGETGEKKQYFCAFKYAVKKVIYYHVCKKKSNVRIQLSEELTEEDLNGTKPKICLAVSDGKYEPYGRGNPQGAQELKNGIKKYKFSTTADKNKEYKIAFDNENEGRDALVVFLKEYEIKREKKWSSKERLLRCPYCSKPLLKKDKIKEGKYFIRNDAMIFSQAGEEESVVTANAHIPDAAKGFIEQHYLEKGELHCLGCEMKRYKLFRNLEQAASSQDEANTLRGDISGKVKIVDTVLPAPYERGLTLGFIGSSGSGKSSFIAESMCLSIVNVQSSQFYAPGKKNAALPLVPYKQWGYGLLDLTPKQIAQLEMSAYALQPHVHTGYVKMVYGPNVNQTESKQNIQEWLEAYPFLLQFTEGDSKRHAYFACFDFPGKRTTDTDELGQLKIMNNIDAVILFLDPGMAEFDKIESMIAKIKKNRTSLNAEKTNKKASKKAQTKDEDFILAVVLCKFDTRDGTKGNGGRSDLQDLQFNCNNYVCTTPACLTEKQYEGSKLSRYIENCSIEVEGWLRSNIHITTFWDLIESIPTHKFFAVSSLGNRHSITGDPQDAQVRFMDNGRGLELVYTWLAYQAGIIE